MYANSPRIGRFHYQETFNMRLSRAQCMNALIIFIALDADYITEDNLQ
jgi:hypothetical protein